MEEFRNPGLLDVFRFASKVTSTGSLREMRLDTNTTTTTTTAVDLSTETMTVTTTTATINYESTTTYI